MVPGERERDIEGSGIRPHTSPHLRRMLMAGANRDAVVLVIGDHYLQRSKSLARLHESLVQIEVAKDTIVLIVEGMREPAVERALVVPGIFNPQP